MLFKFPLLELQSTHCRCPWRDICRLQRVGSCWLFVSVCQRKAGPRVNRGPVGRLCRCWACFHSFLKSTAQFSRSASNISCRVCTAPLGSLHLSAFFSSASTPKQCLLQSLHLRLGTAIGSSASPNDGEHHSLPSHCHPGLASSLWQTKLCYPVTHSTGPESWTSSRGKEMAQVNCRQRGCRGQAVECGTAKGQSWGVDRWFGVEAKASTAEEKCEVLT